MNVYLGTYNISNTQVDMYLTIDFDYLSINYQDTNILMSINIPENYPDNTSLYKFFNNNVSDSSEDQNNICYAIFSIKNRKSSGWNAFLPENHIFMNDAKNQLILREFFSMRDANIKLDNDEKAMIHGLGKRMLCLGIPYMLDYYDIDPSTTPISLTSMTPKKLREYYHDKYGFIEQYPSIDRKTGEIAGYVMSTMLYTFMELC